MMIVIFQCTFVSSIKEKIMEKKTKKKTSKEIITFYFHLEIS